MNLDPITTALTKGGVEEGVKAAKPLLEKLCGPALEELGLLLQDRARVYRLKNQLRILSKVQIMLREAGTTVQAVPLRTLLPLLEGAALEDSKMLSDMWAGLLASAASFGESESIHPSFPRILSELTPREAHILDKVYQDEFEKIWEPFREELANEFEISLDEVNQAQGNLFRLGLCHLSSSPKGTLLKLSAFGRQFLKSAYGPIQKR